MDFLIACAFFFFASVVVVFATGAFVFRDELTDIWRQRKADRAALDQEPKAADAREGT